MEQLGTISDKSTVRYHKGDYILEHWTYFKTLLLKGKKAWIDYETIESLQLALINNKLQLWTIDENGVAVLTFITRIDEYPTGKREIVIQHVIGSRFFRSLKFLERISYHVEVFARAVNCTSIKIHAIPAFVKPLNKMGFIENLNITLVRTVMPKERMN